MVIIAFGMGSSGTAVVDGGGSYLDARAGAGQLIVAGGGAGSLSVTGGGLAEAREVMIGDGFAATGTVVVRGAGSRLTAVDEIDVGLSGVATLTVADGGIAAAPLIVINNQSSVHGNGTLQGDVTNHGALSPGESTGALHINGNYTQTSTGKLQIEIGGTTPGIEYDQLLVTGGVALDGTLGVSLINTFAPTREITTTSWTSLASRASSPPLTCRRWPVRCNGTHRSSMSPAYSPSCCPATTTAMASSTPPTTRCGATVWAANTRKPTTMFGSPTSVTIRAAVPVPVPPSPSQQQLRLR